MDYKKNIIIFCVVSTLFISILPVINFINKRHPVISQELFNTDVLESYVNYFFFKTLNRSTNNDEVIVGTNDYLFLGDMHARVVSKTLNIYPHNNFAINKWSHNLAQLQKWYEDQNIKFVMAVVPNKHSIYPEYLPNWIKYTDNNITDKLVKSSLNNKLNILDLRKPLLKNKKNSTQQLYYKADSHWNSFGASIGYEAILDFLNERYGQQYHHKTEYQFQNKYIGGQGLSRLLKINEMLPKDFELTSYLKIMNEQKICHGKIDSETKHIKNCKVIINKAFDIHKGPHYTINDNPLNDESVLFLTDSFSLQNARLFNLSFQKIWKWHYNKLLADNLKEFVKKQKPSIVIYQIVERALYKNKFINIDMSN